MTPYNRREFLSLVGHATLVLAAGRSSAGAGPKQKRRPNIVFVLLDDLGWAELGCYGNTFNETPHLDKLAREGTLFARAYAAAPVCSPTRAAFLTGQWPARVGITDFLRPDDPKHLSADRATLAEVLKQAGYATGLVGKWHLSGYAKDGATEVTPKMHGFDEVILSEKTGIGDGSYFHPYHFNLEAEQRLRPTEYLVDRLNLEAVDYIERHRNEPFFLFLSHYAVHTGLVGKPELVAKYGAKPGSGKGPNARRNNPHLAAMLESVDQGVGLIKKKLDELGLADHTIIIFNSDNGGEDRVTPNDGLRSGKSTLYEGGLRVPLIVHYPGVTPGGAVCATPICTVDFYPTFLDVAGVAPGPKQRVDGVSILPLLRHASAKLGRSALYWHYPLERPHFLGGRSSGAILSGNWKLIRFYDDNRVELYNLKDDPGEKKDLAAAMPEKTAELRRRFDDWLKAVAAR